MGDEEPRSPRREPHDGQQAGPSPNSDQYNPPDPSEHVASSSSSPSGMEPTAPNRETPNPLEQPPTIPRSQVSRIPQEMGNEGAAADASGEGSDAHWPNAYGHPLPPPDAQTVQDVPRQERPVQPDDWRRRLDRALSGKVVPLVLAGLLFACAALVFLRVVMHAGASPGSDQTPTPVSTESPSVLTPTLSSALTPKPEQTVTVPVNPTATPPQRPTPKPHPTATATAPPQATATSAPRPTAPPRPTRSPRPQPTAKPSAAPSPPATPSSAPSASPTAPPVVSPPASASPTAPAAPTVTGSPTAAGPGAAEVAPPAIEAAGSTPAP
jgi:hypothetical protein